MYCYLCKQDIINNSYKLDDSHNYCQDCYEMLHTRTKAEFKQDLYRLNNYLKPSKELISDMLRDYMSTDDINIIAILQQFNKLYDILNNYDNLQQNL